MIFLVVAVSFEESFLVQNGSQELCQEPKHKTKREKNKNKKDNQNPPGFCSGGAETGWGSGAFVFACAAHTGGPAPAAMPARALSMLPPLGTEAEAPGRVISRIGTHPSAGT